MVQWSDIIISIGLISSELNQAVVGIYSTFSSVILNNICSPSWRFSLLPGLLVGLRWAVATYLWYLAIITCVA